MNLPPKLADMLATDNIKCDISEFDRVRVVRHRERGPLSDAQLIEADRAFFPTATLGRTPNLVLHIQLHYSNRSMFHEHPL